MEPLDPEVRALIDRGLGAAWPSAAIEARSLDRLLEKIAADPGDGGGDDGSSGDHNGGDDGSSGDHGGGVDASIDPGAALATTKAGGLASTVHAVVIVGLITAGAAAISALAGGPRSTPSAPIAADTSEARPVLEDRSSRGDRSVLQDISHDADHRIVSDESSRGGRPVLEDSASGGDRVVPPEGSHDVSDRGDRSVLAQDGELHERSTAPAGEPGLATPRQRPTAERPEPPRVVDLRGEDPLVAETRLVAEAEAALARGEPARARDLARDLARAFPKGQLTLEREAIELCARCGLGEPGAGQAARAFLSTHADAPVAARVRARCESTLKSLGP